MREINPNLIRAYLDGELPPDEAAKVREHLEADRATKARFEFEGRLKDAVKSSMSASPAAPGELRRSIREQIERQERVETAAESGTVVGWLDALLQRFSQPKPVSVGAVFGVVILVSAAILFGIFYPQIDSTPREQRTELIADDPAEYASQEHDRCARNMTHRMKKLHFCTPHEAALALSEHFDVERVTVFDLTQAGYVFLGEARCGMPGTKLSAHLLYKRQVEGETPAKVSIFLARMEDTCVPKTGCGRELRAGEWQRSRKGSQCRKRVLQTTDNSLVYYLVSCDESDVETIAEAVGRTLLAQSR